MRTPRRRAHALLVWLLFLGVVLALIVAGGIWVVNVFRPPERPLTVGCTADAGGTTYRLAPDQAANAALITALSVQRGLPARAASIGLAVALQESKLRNIQHGDLDSVGLFQQRPSQGWGTINQLLDPVYATNAFFDELETVPGYETLPITDAAQIVQRSAYPQAYAQREDQAKAFASALTGLSPATLSCTLEAPPAAGNPSAVVAGLEEGFGPITASVDATGVTLGATDSTGWSYAQWAVANAANLNITEVAFDGFRWTRTDNDQGHNRGWQASSAPADTVRITVNALRP